jgi:hypothetical protein
VSGFLGNSTNRKKKILTLTTTMVVLPQ